MTNYNPVELILKKRSGNDLSPEEISFFIRGYLDGSIAEYQMSALLMTIFFQGASGAEIAALTKTYIDSGKSLKFPADLPVADKHSTGGVGDKISLMLAPIAAACGLYVPMISGRGLGHTGGTLDKLEAIPGFKVQYSLEEFQTLVERYGLAMVGQSAELVPADKRIYALRDVTATVESPGLITASIMSKKIAEGAKDLVIDLKIGSGAFMPNLRRAKELAELLVHTGKSFGQRVSVVFSNMNSPLGEAVGNALEMIEAIDYLKGKSFPDTKALTDALVQRMLISSGLCADETAAQAKIDSVLQSGKALEIFRKMIEVQGGNPRVIEDYSLMGTAKYRLPILAESTGYVHAIDSRKIGYALVRIKAGRMKTTDVLDYAAGALLKPKIGSFLEAGEQIGELLCNDEAEGKLVAELICAAYGIAPLEKASEPLIFETMKP